MSLLWPLRREKADEYLELAQRTRAEFENYRRRAIKEAATAQERGAAKLALELLPAIDNLDRALAHAGETPNGDATFVSGIKHVRSDVLAALKRAGIEPYSPEGEPFDPQFHEAVAQQPFEGFAAGDGGRGLPARATGSATASCARPAWS